MIFVKIFLFCLLPYVSLSLWRGQHLQCSLWGNLFLSFLARSAVLSHPLKMAKKDDSQMTTWKKRQLSLLRETQRQWRLEGREICKGSKLRMSQDRLLDPLWVVLAYEFAVSHSLQLTESDRADGIHDCIQLCWASLYTRPYKLWSNSNAHHDYSTNSMMIVYADQLNMNEHSYILHITCPRCVLSVISRM